MLLMVNLSTNKAGKMKKTVILTFLCSSIFVPFLKGQNNELMHQVILHLEKGNWQEAWQISTALYGNLNNKEICYGDPVIRLLHGHTSLAFGNYNQAMNQFYCDCDSLNSESLQKWRLFCQKLVLTNPWFSSAHYLFGDALARLEQYDSARIEFTKALELNPNNYLALNARGVNEWIWSKLKNETMCLKCTEDWDSIIHNYPEMADAYANKAVSFLLVGGNEERCISYFSSALQKNDNFILAYNGKAVAYLSSGQSEMFFDVLPFTKGCIFYDLQKNVEKLDSLIIECQRNPEKCPEILKEAIGKVRGNLTHSNPIVSGTANLIDGMTRLGESFNFRNDALTNLGNAYYSIKDWSRGGVYSWQIEGINKDTRWEGQPPSITGTWFLLNYPSKPWKIIK